jgi:hypothetical protein
LELLVRSGVQVISCDESIYSAGIVGFSHLPRILGPKRKSSAAAPSSFSLSDRKVTCGGVMVTRRFKGRQQGGATAER